MTTLEEALQTLHDAFEEQRQSYAELAERHDALRKAYRDLKNDIITEGQEEVLLEFLLESFSKKKRCPECLEPSSAHRDGCALFTIIKVLERRQQTREEGQRVDY